MGNGTLPGSFSSAWIRVVASSRRETELLDLFGRYSPVEIDTSSSENRRDIDAYMDKRFAEPDFVQRMASAHADADSIRRLLGGRSRGNFLYVAQTMEALAAGRIDPLAPDTVPDGLVGIYHSFFDRIFPGARGYDSLRAILDVLVAAREPVTAGLVAACLDSSVFDVEKRLEPVAAFFPQRSGRYQAYHKSVLDWLAGRAGHNLAFRVDLVGGHRKIAGALLKRFQAGDWGEDVLAHLPFHLVEGGMWDEVTDLLTALEFIAAKAAGGEVHGLVRDFQMALSKLPEAADEAARETENRDRRREFASSLAALSRGEDVELEVVHAPAPEELAGGGRKLGLSAGSSRQTRLRAFAQFAGVHRHALARFAGFPGFVAQHAYNAAGDGPVARAAEEALSAAGLSPHVRVSSRHRGAFVPYPALLHTLEGHGSYIESIDISADGQRIVSAGADEQTARVWDLQTGACLAVLSGHDGRVCSVSVSADGRVAASGSWDRTIRVWDLESGEEVARLQGHEAHTAVHLSPDGQRLLSGGEDGALRLWDVRTATFRSLRDAGLTRVTAVAASADSRIALCGTEDGTVEVWDSRQGTRSLVLAGHSDRVSSIAVTPDGSRALSGGWDRQIRLWDLQSGKAIATLEGHAEAVLDVAISADGNVGASVASSKGWRQSDNLVWLWDLRTGRCIKKLGGHVDRINCVALDVDARRAATGGWDRTVRVWDVERGGGAPTLSGHMEIVNTLCVAGDTGKVVSCSNDETVRVWNMETQDDEQTLEGHSHWVNSAVLAPDGETILSGGHDAVVRRWNLATGGSLPPLVRLPYAVSSLALAEAGRVIVACLAPEVFVVDLASGDVVGTLKGHKDHVNAVAISPAGTLAATASNDGSIRLWSVPERSCRKVLEGHRGPVRTIAFSPDGGELCSGGSDGAVVVWNIARGQPVHTLVGHSGPVASVRSLDGGALLLSSGWDGTFRVWNLRRGECIAIYQAEGAVRCISERVGEWKVLLGLSTGRIVEIELWNMPDGKNPEPA
jgi:WD40 repeat protein